MAESADVSSDACPPLSWGEPKFWPSTWNCTEPVGVLLPDGAHGGREVDHLSVGRARYMVRRKKRVSRRNRRDVDRHRAANIDDRPVRGKIIIAASAIDEVQHEVSADDFHAGAAARRRRSADRTGSRTSAEWTAGVAPYL